MTRAPMWPELLVEPAPASLAYLTDQPAWSVTTCTMRPPVRDGRGQTFKVYIVGPKDAEEAATMGRLEMWKRYTEAHPENCAGTKQADLTVVD